MSIRKGVCLQKAVACARLPGRRLVERIFDICTQVRSMRAQRCGLSTCELVQVVETENRVRVAVRLHRGARLQQPLPAHRLRLLVRPLLYVNDLCLTTYWPYKLQVHRRLQHERPDVLKDRTRKKRSTPHWRHQGGARPKIEGGEIQGFEIPTEGAAEVHI